MLQVDYMFPLSGRWVRVQSIFNIATPEHNPNHFSEANTVIRHCLGKNGVGKATWLGGRYDQSVIFNGNAEDLYDPKEGT